MPVPKYHEIFPALLKCLKDKKVHNVDEINLLVHDKYISS